MSTFTPDPGTLFYAESTMMHTRVVGDGSTAVAIKERDHSFEGAVFRCVARDDRAVVADLVHGVPMYGTARRLLVRTNYKFHPVGPGIADALGIEGEGR